MKTFLSLIIFPLPILLFGQVPTEYDYPDTLWVYGQANDISYGLTSENPVKVGGEILPKHVYRYLNSLSDSNGTKVSYERVGSCCNEAIKREEPLTTFKVDNGGSAYLVYFDQYEWEQPKVIIGFGWIESRSGYYGEFSNDSTFRGYGIYFFEDGGYYKGNWDNGMMSGQGEMLIPEQERYLGEFKEGEYHGQGTLFYPDEGKYVGQWVQGLKEGDGIIYYPPGSDIRFIEGTFENDSPIGTFKVANSDRTEETHEF